MSGFKLSENSSTRQHDEPLGMTVHSMPAPGAALAANGQRTIHGHWKMLAVLLVCAAPVIASYFTYYVIRPEGRRNFGALINPQRPLPDQTGVGLSGEVTNLQSLKGQWLLINVAGGACDEVCANNLYLQRQMREGLGKDKDRLDRVWLITDDAPVAQALRPALKDAAVLRVPQVELEKWLVAADGEKLSSHLYVVDPLGNWMMRFPANLGAGSAPQAKRDLERLMRASAFWDKAGRESKL